MQKLFEKNKFIILLLAVTFLFRIPSLFEPYFYGDETIYLTLGLAVKKGLLLYRDIFDNKTPLIYLVAALANGSLFWFRFFLTFSVLTTIFFFYRFSKEVFAGQKTPVLVATTMFAVLTTIRLFEGNIANAEIFILLPVVSGFYLFSPYILPTKEKISSLITISSGLTLGLGLLFKVPAVFDFLALLCFLLLLKEKKRLVSLGKTEILLSVGYLLPITATGLLFFLKGYFPLFFKSCFLQTMGYLSSWKTGSHAFSLNSLLKTDLFLNGIFVLAVLITLWFLKNKIRPFFLFLSLWFTFSLFAATISGRPYPHYLMQVVPPLCLGIGFFSTFKKENLFLPLVMISLLLTTNIRYHFWGYNSITYYQNFLSFITGKIDKTAYFSYFNPKTTEIYKLSEFIANFTLPGDKIFVWADEPSFYTLSRRLPAGRFVVAYHIVDFNLYEETAQQIQTQKPKLIITDLKARDFPALESILEEDYLKIDATQNYLIFRKKLL